MHNLLSELEDFIPNIPDGADKKKAHRPLSCLAVDVCTCVDMEDFAKYLSICLSIYLYVLSYACMHV